MVEFIIFWVFFLQLNIYSYLNFIVQIFKGILCFLDWFCKRSIEYFFPSYSLELLCNLSTLVQGDVFLSFPFLSPDFIFKNYMVFQSLCSVSSIFFICTHMYVWTGIAKSVYRLAMSWTVRESNSGGGKIFCNRPEVVRSAIHHKPGFRHAVKHSGCSSVS